ncbi:MAG: YifB family Mg chelatase-like AAA ATPase [Clostridia bacterium]|nr:YifB family Mg chelatase-like AAA ATPase [Clostridia bacterium]
MIAKIQSYTLYGLNGIPVEVEVDVNNGLPAFDIVGLGDAAVKESKERVRSAIKNSGRSIPPKKITANFAPAFIKKSGSAFDLPLAVGVLCATGQIVADFGKTVFLGELSLDGSVKKAVGVLPILIAAIADGYKTFIVPKENAKEASFVSGAEIYAAESLAAVIDHLSGLKPLEKVLPAPRDMCGTQKSYDSDMAFVKGQAVAKRALEVAVSGGHNILFVGAPGTGKTMLAKCIPSIMPDMSFEEAVETTKIYSVAGLLDNEGIINLRPFRSPHHTATSVALTGGGTSLRPGEISLAHNGVLFLDEMPEYSRATLEALRQPLEDGVISVSRASGTVKYPANFILCGSMNPCPCGNYGSATKECTCTPAQIAKYKARISGPLLDRIDIKIDVDEVKYSELTDKAQGESSADIRKRVNRTRKIQAERFKNDGIATNADMREKHIAKYCVLSNECEKILKNAYESLHLSPRARSRIIKVARTIADMDLYDDILPKHLLEAINYRNG